MDFRCALFILALCTLSLAAPTQEATILSFRKFLKDFNKTYEHPSEYTRRFQIFQCIQSKRSKLFQTHGIGDKKGAVTAVKDQGQCGNAHELQKGCWAFSAVANMEGQWFLAGHPLIGLSEQNLVDCDHECMTYEGQQSCDSGCNGGLMPNAFHYVKDNGGIDSESGYPYVAFDQTCAYSPSSKAATISNWTMIASDEDQMAAYMVNKGPISIAVDATLWQFYFGGVFDFPWCGTSLNHGVAIVGYGKATDILDEPIDFWWVKNSWGTGWGYDGYIKLEKGNGECGDNLFACSAIV